MTRPWRCLAAVTTLAFSAACGSALPHADIVRAGGGVAGGVADPASGGDSAAVPSREPGANAGTGGVPVAGAALGAQPGAQQGAAGQSSASRALVVTGTGPKAGGRTVDTSPIVLGSVGDDSGAPGATLRASSIGVQVWAAAVNANGGIMGHPVKVIVEDSKGDPTAYRAALQDLVENQHVVAFVGNAGEVAAGKEYLERKRVPVVGSGDGVDTWRTSPMHFSVAGDANALPYGDLAAAVQQGKSKIAILACVETPACPAWRTSAEKYAPEVGASIVYTADISIAQADFTAECLNARNAGAQTMAVVADTNTVYRVARSCGQQGYHPTYIVGTPADTDAQKADLDGAISAMHTFPYFGVPGNPQADEFTAAVKRYAPDTPRMQYLATGWASGKVFQRAAELGIGAAKPTSAGVLKGLYAIKQGETLNGLVPPLHYKQNAPNPESFCYYLAVLRNGHYVAPSGMTATCPKR